MYHGSQLCVHLGNGLTDPFKLGVGVREGDVLSPNLFKIYNNDLPKYLHSCPDPVYLKITYLHCLMYADDVVILSESALGLQEKLKKLEAYCADWCLYVNIDKTKVMTFNKAGRVIKSNFVLQNETTECVSTYRYLGFTFFCIWYLFIREVGTLYKKGLN